MTPRHLGTVADSIRAEYARPWVAPAVSLPAGRILRAHLWRWAEFTGVGPRERRWRWLVAVVAMGAACVWAAVS